MVIPPYEELIPLYEAAQTSLTQQVKQEGEHPNFAKIPGDWKSRLHRQSLPPQVKD